MQVGSHVEDTFVPGGAHLAAAVLLGVNRFFFDYLTQFIEILPEELSQVRVETEFGEANQLVTTQKGLLIATLDDGLDFLEDGSDQGTVPNGHCIRLA